MLGFGSDRRRVDDDLGTLQRIKSRQLGKPLVVAGWKSESPLLELEDVRSIWGATGLEVVVLVIATAARDVHLARPDHHLSFRRSDDRSVVAKSAFRGDFEQGGQHVCTGLGRQSDRKARAPSVRYGFRLRAVVRRDRKVGRKRELLGADQPRAFAGRQPHPGRDRLFLDCGISMPTLLHDGDANRLPRRRERACRRPEVWRPQHDRARPGHQGLLLGIAKAASDGSAL